MKHLNIFVFDTPAKNDLTPNFAKTNEGGLEIERVNFNSTYWLQLIQTTFKEAFIL